MEQEGSYFFNFEKLAYIREVRPKDFCILCAVTNQDPAIANLGVLEGSFFIVSLNLYPFNPGHLIIFPKRHLEDIGSYSDAEVMELHRLSAHACTALRETHHARGFNIGYNMGSTAGASIEHLHLHIIPRYGRELGIADLIGGTRPLVQHPLDTQKQLQEWFATHPLS